MELKVLTTEPVIEIDGVKFHHHPNGGGLVAETAEVAETVFVDYTAIVRDKARIFENALIKNRAIVCGNAQVFGNAKVADEATVDGNAQIFGDALLFRKTYVSDRAKIHGGAKLFDVVAMDNTEIAGNVQISNGKISGDLKIIDKLV